MSSWAPGPAVRRLGTAERARGPSCHCCPSRRAEQQARGARRHHRVGRHNHHRPEEIADPVSIEYEAGEDTNRPPVLRPALPPPGCSRDHRPAGPGQLVVVRSRGATAVVIPAGSRARRAAAARIRQRGRAARSGGGGAALQEV